MRYQFEKDLYPKAAFIKAAYNFTDEAYLHLSQNDKEWIVDLTPKPNHSYIELHTFENEMLAQSARCLILNQTKNIRELIMARAFASTIIDTQESQESMSEDMNISDALKDWFEGNE